MDLLQWPQLALKKLAARCGLNTSGSVEDLVGRICDTDVPSWLQAQCGTTLADEADQLTLTDSHGVSTTFSIA